MFESKRKYEGVYAKIKKMDFTKWVVTKFYHYTSCAQDVFAKYDPFWHDPAWGDPYVKEVYDHFLKCADAYVNYPEHDLGSLGHQNKTTIEIFNIETGEKLYVTQYDGVYSIGRDVYSEFGNVTEFGVIKK